ncbi:LysR family transcriptional regulator [Bordetella genomosp. 5]|uniref:LysR family transcriptional regulator n=1 Tax=Bordetella genomosp. 5 TaxID=1395608 RepID=A0A261TEK4_9BORD|nr:transcriptional regulator GcvA [Bordetella genomosp. 5]OZI41407.1 LysR family transcriptional regulator [Bordetella genomosp. 5]OZI48068.1 LysR family transcriptional regulator [Bordetella genomosp. 5]
MRRFCPSLTDLQAFEVAARHSSFTRAAQELCVTQGAVSKQVKHLEEFVGVELFLRIRQGLVLTEAGRSYLKKVQAGLSQIEAATVELIAHQGRGGTLNLTAMPTFGARWLIPRLIAFNRLRPDIHVEFMPHRQGYDFSTPELDAAVRFGEGIWPGSGADYIVGREIVPVCSPRLIAEGCDDAADLLRYPLLHHTSALEGWFEWFEQAGCDTRRSLEGARFDQYSLLSQAAAASFGIALIPRCLIEDELRDGKLVVPIQLPIRARQGYYLCYPEQKANLPTLQAFRAWLMEVSRAAEPVPAATDAIALK